MLDWMLLAALIVSLLLYVVILIARLIFPSAL